MSPTPITAVDLNLLKVLHALAIKGISHALKRLRAITGDELFIRTRKGLP